MSLKTNTLALGRIAGGNHLVAAQDEPEPDITAEEQQALSIDMAVHEAKKSPRWMRQQIEDSAWRCEIGRLTIEGKLR